MDGHCFIALCVLCTLTSECLTFPAHRRDDKAIERDPGFYAVRRYEFPFLTAITYDGHYEGCGGALVDPYVVLTSAHCVQKLEGRNLSLVHVQIGGRALVEEPELVIEGNRSLVLPVRMMMKHPLYFESAGGHRTGNIGLLLLDKPSFRRNRIQIDKRSHNRLVHEVEECYYAGYSIRKGSKPHKFQARVKHDQECSEFVQYQVYIEGYYYDHVQEFCVISEYASICREDGFPYFCDIEGSDDFTLLGVASWSTCSGKHHSNDSFFARAGVFRGWIWEQVKWYRRENNADVEEEEAHWIDTTTVADINGSSKTTEVDSGGSQQTSVADINGSSKTTVADNSGSSQTTVADNSGSSQTTVADNGGSSQTTVADNGGSSQTTMADNGGSSQTTMADNGGSSQTTMAESDNGGSSQTTVADNGGSSQNTMADNGGGFQTTLADNGGSSQTTVAYNGGSQQTTVAYNGGSQQTTVAYNGGSQQTTVAYNGGSQQTTVAYNGGSQQTTVAYNGGSQQTTVAYNGGSQQTSMADNSSSSPPTFV